LATTVAWPGVEDRTARRAKPRYLLRMSLITTEREGAVATLWLDRPEKRNALDAAMMRELAAALDAVRDDLGVRAIVLRGRGPMFSSGIDHTLLLEVFQKSRSAPFPHLHADLQGVFDRLERMHRPVVAVLHGACMGMALELALACDLRLATADCVLGLPEIAFGILPDVGGTTRLTRLAGGGRAREMILTGKAVRARTAERWGVVNEVADDDADLARRLERLLGRLTSHPLSALGHAKHLIAAAEDTGAATALRLEGIFQEVLLAQPDLPSRFPQALAFLKKEMADPD
jgi:enoyl-CoA hydratase/carnithine racemase